jgi:S-adenosylmethionine-diacylgycerolhomoserine-N-methlytransferase
MSNSPRQASKMVGFYRLHAKIYDSTRWTFLFGRDLLLQWLSFPSKVTFQTVEVGCGTGYNLAALAQHFPNMQLTGIDVSPDMLTQAEKTLLPWSKRVQLIQDYYQDETLSKQGIQPDLMLFSYALTMFNPGWEAALAQAVKDLKPGGLIAVTDFHDTRWGFFRWWMGVNHVRMEAHLLPVLEQHFQTLKCEVKPAYGGLWNYFVFLGEKRIE